MKYLVLMILLGLISTVAYAKEIALTFDDAPMGNSKHFKSQARTEELIRKLKELNVPPVIVFATACKREDSASVTAQLRKYKDAGHLIGNHTCSHPRLDDVGFAAYAKDAEKGDRLLASLFPEHKFFRFPFLNEGSEEKVRGQMRKWLTENHYRNGMVSIDTDDYIFSSKLNQAKKLGKKIDYQKVEKLLVMHLVGAAKFYDDLALKTLGYSPKHVMLLHEMDATVMSIDSLVKELRNQGWKIISAEEAYRDKIYFENLKNTNTSDGVIAQMAFEKTKEKVSYHQMDEIKDELDYALGLTTVKE